MTSQVTPVVLEIIKAILQDHPAGVNEIQLIRVLRDQHPELPFDHKPGDSLSLFRAHFLLFHCLYLLQQQMAEGRQTRLEISPLRIVLLPSQSPKTSLTEADPLRSYYLDLGNLERTTGADVDKMLDNFWRKYVGSDKRREALDILGLKDPVDDATIKQRYRKLAMKHHPDRGGNALQLQTIHAAIRALLP